jgi:hypothetical protein
MTAIQRQTALIQLTAAEKAAGLEQCAEAMLYAAAQRQLDRLVRAISNVGAAFAIPLQKLASNAL